MYQFVKAGFIHICGSSAKGGERGKGWEECEIWSLGKAPGTYSAFLILGKLIAFLQSRFLFLRYLSGVSAKCSQTARTRFQMFSEIFFKIRLLPEFSRNSCLRFQNALSKVSINLYSLSREVYIEAFRGLSLISKSFFNCSRIVAEQFRKHCRPNSFYTFISTIRAVYNH